MDLLLKNLIICVIAIPVGILLGNSAVYVFNRIPGKWLTDYGEEPSEELLRPTVQRLKSVPYKYAFTGLFISAAIYMGIHDPECAVFVLAALWLLLLMSAADIKYTVVPDQLIMLLILTGIGYLPQRVAIYHRHAVYDSLIGAGIGFALLLSVALLSRAIYRKWVLGGADIKLFTAIGFLSGIYGVLIIFVITTFLSAIHLGWLLIRGETSLKEERPMVPYIALAFACHFLFIKGMLTDFALII